MKNFTKLLFALLFSISSFNVFSQTSLISACGDFVAGPTAWPYVLVATTPDSGTASQGAQTFSMNVTSLPSGGATFRVAKTTANGNWWFGSPQTMVVGSNGITVASVSFNRAVKFQFSSGDPEFDLLVLNGDTSDCAVAILGCTDPNATNYDSLATQDDGSCVYCSYGCMDSLACNYDPTATCDDGSCLTAYGCTDTLACNFDPMASCDDGSCLIAYGCTDTLACNYDPAATCDDGSCLTAYGCTDTLACNFNPMANCDDGSCLTTYGCTDSLATNYNPLATCDDSSCVYGYYVTFQLDLRGVTSITYTTPEVNGMFNGWCGNCNALQDLDGDSIWETTILLDSGSYEYKYSVDNWAVEENLFSGDSCTVSSNGFTNRFLDVSKDTVLDPVCWELCEDCDADPSSYNVTFRLDMSEYVGPPFTTPEVNGTFNNWCGSCWAMEDLDGDNVWEFTALIGAGDTILYKYSADNWNIQEELDSSLSCISIGYDPGAPNGWGYVNRSEVVNSELILDVVCWNDCVECQGQSSVEENSLSALSLYPNPSSGAVQIESIYEILQCNVYNVIGELVYSNKDLSGKNNHRLSIEKTGLYYITVYTEKGVFSNKITIHK